MSKVKEDLTSNRKPHHREIGAQNMDDVIIGSLVRMPTDIWAKLSINIYIGLEIN